MPKLLQAYDNHSANINTSDDVVSDDDDDETSQVPCR